ncbi:MAG: outer membrane lipoprotein-sorting protein [Halobacteriovoraceae bacterium]|nr:outer membrane lipoprotein-sorting protein [Halobacteriovoraceae bacterium]
MKNATQCFNRFLLLTLLTFTQSTYAVDIASILNKVDQLYRAQTSISNISMKIETPNWQRTLNMTIWTKGLELTFVTIHSPKKDQGISTLKRDNEMWNYFPKINKVMKVPPSMMMGSWMGSDLTNDDLVKENTYLDDYNAKLKIENDEEYLIELTPKEQTISIWGKIEIVIDKKRLIPRKQFFYDEKNTIIRTMSFLDVKNVDGREIPVRLEIVPHTEQKTGHKTTITYENISFNPPIPPETFTRSNLQKRR